MVLSHIRYQSSLVQTNSDSTINMALKRTRQNICHTHNNGKKKKQQQALKLLSSSICSPRWDNEKPAHPP